MKNPAIKLMFASCLAVSAVIASEAKLGQQSHSNADFDKLKTLVGKWEGSHKTPNGEEKVPATYELTSGGSALVEKVSGGSPHEMLSVYHPDGKDVEMTHYCMIGNQPTMKLKKKDKDSMTFDFVSGTNMKSKKDPHMHTLKVTWLGPDEFHQDWTFFENGKATSTETFAYKRVK